MSLAPVVTRLLQTPDCICWYWSQHLYHATYSHPSDVICRPPAELPYTCWAIAFNLSRSGGIGRRATFRA